MLNDNKKPVILLAFANSHEGQRGFLRSLAKEQSEIEEALEAASQVCDLQVRSNATLEDIVDSFLKHRDRIAIFHYAGHANSYQLLLETDAGALEAANAAGISQFLAQRRGLKLVFLNGCSTQSQVDDLHRAGIPVVIATTRPVDDTQALNFAQTFYKALSTGSSVRSAFLEAQGVVRASTVDDGTRHLLGVPEGAGPSTADDWQLFPDAPDDPATSWTLAEIADDPLFGLPPIPPREEDDWPESPFRNLDWFGPQHAEFFFGRGQEIRELYDQITSPDAASFVLFYGQSGVGKSSVLAAGLTPRLESQYDIHYVRRDQRLGALGTLKALAITREKPTVIILDQLEEIFTQANNGQTSNDQASKQELNALIEAVLVMKNASPVRLIFGFRKEYLPEIETAFKAYGVSPAKVFLQPLSQAGMIEAIEGPARSERLEQHFHLTLAAGLAEQIAADLDDKDSPVAPTLQILLSKMWEEALRISPSEPHFDQALYDSLKKDYSHLEGFLEQQLQKLKAWRTEVVNSGLAIDLLAFHTTALGTAQERSLEEIQQTYSRKDILEVVTQTQALYLIADPRSERSDQPPATRLAHDTLAPLVRRRYETSDLPGQKTRRILQSRIQEAADDQKTLLNKRELVLVEAGLQGTQGLSLKEKAFLTKSQQANSRRGILSAFLTGIIGLIALGSLATLGFGFSKKAEADKNAVLGLMAQGLAKLDSGQDLGLLLLLQANKLNDTWPTRSGLLQGIQFDPRLITTLSNDANRVSVIAISPDGTTLAVASGNGKLYVWDMRKRILLHEFSPKPSGFLSTVAFSTDGTWLATGGEARAIFIWNTNTWAQRELGTGHQGWVNRLAFRPGKSKTILASASQDGSVKIFDFSRMRSPLVKDIREPEMLADESSNEVNAIDFSEDGNLLASGGTDAKIRIWDANTGRLNREFPSNDDRKRNRTSFHKQTINGLAFHPTKNILASVSNDRTIILWDIKTGKPIAKPFLGHTREVISVAFNPEGNLMLTGSSDGSARLWDVASNQAYGEPFTGHVGSVVSLAFSPNGQSLMTATSQGSVYVWRASQRKTLGTRLANSYKPFSALAFDRRSKTIMTGTLDGHVQVWDQNKGRISTFLQIEPDSIPEKAKEILALAFHPTKDVFAVSTRHGSLQFRNTKNQTLIAQREGLGRTFGVSFSSNGQLMASGGSQKEITLWDTSSLTPKPYRLTLQGHQNQIISLQFSPDGKILASGDFDGKIIFWDIGQCEPIKAACKRIGDPIPAHSEFIRTLTFSPDGKILASAGKDRAIRLWDVATRTLIGRPLLAHTAVVSSLVFAGDSQTLVSGSFDGTLIVWDVPHQRALGKPLFGHSGYVRGVAFIPLRKPSSPINEAAKEVLVSVSEDKTVLLRTVGLEDLKAQICQKANRDLTLTEWRDFVGEIPYQKTCTNVSNPDDPITTAQSLR